jgi:hypothetical protein
MMTAMDDSAPAPADGVAVPSGRARTVLLGLALALMTAATAWLLGHLPWVVSGFSWPTTEAAPVGSSTEGLSGVRLAIPLVAQFLPSLIAFTTIGAVAATLLPLLLTTRESGHRLPAVAVSVVSLLLTVTVVTLLARGSIEAHAADAFAGDPRVLRGLVLVVAGATLVGALFGTLASVQVGFLPLAVALVCGQLRSWLDAFLLGHDHGPGALRTVDRVGDVLVLVLLTSAFVLSVRRSAAWVVTWPVAVAMIWVATPFGVMTTYLAGQLRPSAGLPGSLPDILSAGLDVFRASFWEAPQARWPWVVAVLLALAWLVVERGRARARR